jgi:hypothetical protein
MRESAARATWRICTIRWPRRWPGPGSGPVPGGCELTGTLTRGMTIADWSYRWGREPNALIGVGVDPVAFFDRFMARVRPFAKRLG